MVLLSLSLLVVGVVVSLTSADLVSHNFPTVVLHLIHWIGDGSRRQTLAKREKLRKVQRLRNVLQMIPSVGRQRDSYFVTLTEVQPCTKSGLVYSNVLVPFNPSNIHDYFKAWLV